MHGVGQWRRRGLTEHDDLLQNMDSMLVKKGLSAQERKGGAVTKVIASLAAKGMVEEDGAGILLITAAAFAALGLEVPGTKAVSKARAGTKQEALIALLKRPEGASIAEIMAVTDWLAQSVRGFISGSLKKTLGLEVTSEKVETRGRVYRIRDC